MITDENTKCSESNGSEHYILYNMALPIYIMQHTLHDEQCFTSVAHNLCILTVPL